MLSSKSLTIVRSFKIPDSVSGYDVKIDTLLCLGESDHSLGVGGLGVGLEKQNYGAVCQRFQYRVKLMHGKFVVHRVICCSRLCQTV
jgi:hypothetical protein